MCMSSRLNKFIMCKYIKSIYTSWWCNILEIFARHYDI